MSILWHLPQFRVESEDGKRTYHAGPMVELIQEIDRLAKEKGFLFWRFSSSERPDFKKNGRSVHAVWSLRRIDDESEVDDEQDLDEWGERELYLEGFDDSDDAPPMEGCRINTLKNEPEEGVNHINVYLHNPEGKTEACEAFTKLSYLLEWIQDAEDAEGAEDEDAEVVCFDVPRSTYTPRPKGFF